MGNVGRLSAGELLALIHILPESLTVVWEVEALGYRAGFGSRTVPLLLDDLDMELKLSESQSCIHKLVIE